VAGLLVVSFVLSVPMMPATLPTALHSRYADRHGSCPGVLALIFAAVAGGILVALLSATGQADPDRRLPICALERERERLQEATPRPSPAHRTA
jgi:hypothetical protein